LNEDEQLWVGGKEKKNYFMLWYRIHRIIRLNKTVCQNYVKSVYLMANVGDHVVM